jgi:hypothetical protein
MRPPAVDLAGMRAPGRHASARQSGRWILLPAKATVKERVMQASVSRPVAQPQRSGTLWWLPSGGISNGIGDDAWAPILDVSADLVAPLLAALREAGVPAYAAAGTRPLGTAPRRHGGAEPDYRLWVGSSAHGRAEETLIRALGRLRHDAVAGRQPEGGRPA